MISALGGIVAVAGTRATAAPSIDSPEHLIFAGNAHNIGVAGPDKIDGQGSNFWKPTSRKPVPDSKLWSDAVHKDWTHTPRHPTRGPFALSTLDLPEWVRGIRRRMRSPDQL
jgi:hypothetical protein